MPADIYCENETPRIGCGYKLGFADEQNEIESALLYRILARPYKGRVPSAAKRGRNGRHRACTAIPPSGSFLACRLPLHRGGREKCLRQTAFCKEIGERRQTEALNEADQHFFFVLFM